MDEIKGPLGKASEPPELAEMFKGSRGSFTQQLLQRLVEERQAPPPPVSKVLARPQFAGIPGPDVQEMARGGPPRGALQQVATPMPSRYVVGPGTGRSDSIPARVARGEYVMDAETVALLGDGSSDAGAEALDQFRHSVRQHKGKALAKGKFSPDAKAPEQYLRGRK
jgi:hypothetical protein